MTVKAGGAFQQVDSTNFILKPGESHHYELLTAELQANNWIPDHVIHAWSLTGTNSNPLQNGSFEHVQDLGFYSLLFFVRALAKQNFGKDLKLFTLSDHIQEVHGNETLIPKKSTLLGPCMVIPQEYPNIRIKSIDLEVPSCGKADDLGIDEIVGEFFSADSELFVAYRNNQVKAGIGRPYTVAEERTVGHLDYESQSG